MITDRGPIAEVFFHVPFLYSPVFFAVWLHIKMVRQRKTPAKEVKTPKRLVKSSDEEKPQVFNTTYTIVASIVVLGGAYLVYQGYLETRVNTPLSVPKVCEITSLPFKKGFQLYLILGIPTLLNL